jgi:formyltetrahydrofolate deformylase
MATAYLLTLSCPNRPGIVTRVTAELFRREGDIIEAQQFDDAETDQFFMRIVANLPSPELADLFRADLDRLAGELDLTWSLRARSARRNVLILVSKFDHCFVDLLYRNRIGELSMNVVAVVSNHPITAFNSVDLGSVPFYHLPVKKETKPAQEAQIKRIFADTGAELVILARYMQILSNDLASFLSGRCINIHHSFLPSFKGAKPYHQAHARGVKLIGATAHYVTADLDEGPIIEQDVERISHYDKPNDLVRKGRDIERRVLARAVAFHLDGRVIVNGSKTVVFRD